jgi:gliding motility-associated-like protein
MPRYLTLFFVFGLLQRLCAQAINADCRLAEPISQTVDFCSADGHYNNQNEIKSTWLKFTATAFDVNISVSGAGNGGTLIAPKIALFSDCSGTELVGTGLTANNITSLYKGGLIIGKTYYINITGDNDAMGTFKVCLNNYNPVVAPGQDCSTASFLCSMSTISQQNVSGAGLNNDEAAGTCLSTPGQASESNSLWYKWQAANSGTLVFTITPTNVKDDIDWVLYDLGTAGDCSMVTAANAIRCKAGYGVENIDCPNDVIYYKTGLDFNEIDVSEPPGCGLGQNGKLKALSMVEGHVYGLLINNFSSGNNGFTIAFTDQQGQRGTGEFSGPKPVISYTAADNCTAAPQFTFKSNSTDYGSLRWSFGEGASRSTANAAGPYQITYSTPGMKIVTLEAITDYGCSVVASQTIAVGIKPPLPAIQINKTQFCINDQIELNTPAIDQTNYSWTGPNNFHSDQASVHFTATGPEVAGIYHLVVTRFGCSSDEATVTVPIPLATPTAAFTPTPAHTDAAYGPVSVSLFNESTGATSYLWDFGDGSSSTERNPNHTYIQKGDFSIKLTAYNNNTCSASVVKANVVTIANNNFIFIPNTFTPNGDGKNDEFQVTISNIRSYHVSIFDRWGSPLFESGDIQQNWKGDHKGMPAPAGTYFYVIHAMGTDGAKIDRSGYITLLK